MGIGTTILEANSNFWKGIAGKGVDGAKGLVSGKKEKQEKPKQWRH